MENKVLAVVNGKEITQDIFDFTISKFPPERKNHFESENGHKELLEQIISWELVYNYAKDSDYEKKEEYLFQIEEAKKAIMGQLVIQEVLSTVNIEDKEVMDYYNQNLDFFNEPEKVSAKHILVATEENANEVLKEINNGMSFEDAAMKYSTCPSKEQGGNLGPFGKGMMVPEFEEVAFKAEIGVISKPVETQFGFHLILVEEKIEPQTKSFDEVKELIKGHMLQEKQNHTYMEFVNNLKNKYTVEVK
jgi:peptidyl-prolyl cis-trans isomerase C